MAKVVIERIATANIWHFTEVPELCIYANQVFDSDGSLVLAGDPLDPTTPHLKVPCELSGDHVVVILEAEIDSTPLTLPEYHTARYTAILRTSSYQAVYLDSFSVPPQPTSMNWNFLRTYQHLGRRFSHGPTAEHQALVTSMIADALTFRNYGSILNPGMVAITTPPVDPLFPIAVSATDPNWTNIAGATAHLAVNAQDAPYNAVGDGATNDADALAAAAAAAMLAHKALYIPGGDYLLSGSAGTEFLLLTRAIEIYGDGETATRLIVDASVANTKSAIRVFPPVTTGSPSGAVATWLIEGSRDNQGYYFHDFSIISANEQIVQTDPYPAQPGNHAIVVDVSTAGQYVYGFSMERVFLGSLGGRGIHFNNSNGAGSFRNQDGIWGVRIHDCGIRNGILAEFWGDSVWISGTYFMGQNAAIESWQTPGATTLNLIGNNYTNRGGLIFHSGLDINFMNNIVELYVVPSTGSNGAAVDFRGDFARIERVTIFGNAINTHIPGNAFNGIRLDVVTTVHVDNNSFWTQSGKFGIITTANVIGARFGVNHPKGTGTLRSVNDPFPVYEAFTINAEPDVAQPATFIPNYLGVEKAYSQLLRVAGLVNPVLPLAGEGMEIFHYLNGRVNGNAVATTGGNGLGVLQAWDRTAVAARDMFLGAQRMLMHAPGGIAFTAGSYFELPKKAGAFTDADFTPAPSDGACGLDTANSRLYVRVGGVWKFTQLT